MSDLTLVLCFFSMLFVPCVVASFTLLRKEGPDEAGLTPISEAASVVAISFRHQDAALSRQELVARRHRELYRRGLL